MTTCTHTSRSPRLSNNKLKSSVFRAIVTSLGLTYAACGLGADKPDLKRGEADYVTYCASCHGVTGEGNGPVANALKNRPPDLTYLHQQETDGAFPYQKVLNIIRGNPDLDKNFRTHGPADMPVWGKIIYEDSGDRDAVAEARLRDLTSYIQSLQK